MTICRLPDLRSREIHPAPTPPFAEQPSLDGRLMLRQPIQIGVEIVLVEADHGAGGVRTADRREPLVEDTGDDLPQGRPALPIRA